jgi:hypothetical protein
MAIPACFVFQREISRSVFWDFFDSIDPNAKRRHFRYVVGIAVAISVSPASFQCHSQELVVFKPMVVAALV